MVDCNNTYSVNKNQLILISLKYLNEWGKGNFKIEQIYMLKGRFHKSQNQRVYIFLLRPNSPGP